jgi:hypothetical protein
MCDLIVCDEVDPVPCLLLFYGTVQNCAVHIILFSSAIRLSLAFLIILFELRLLLDITQAWH